MKTAWILAAFILLLAGQAVCQQARTDSLMQDVQNTISVGRMLTECGIFMWPLIATLFFGLVISLYQLGVLLLEIRRSQSLYVMSFGESRLSDLEKELQKKSGLSEMGQLIQLMISKFRRGEDLEGLYHSEVSHAVNVRKDRFGTYRTWTMFFSDAAGALGLLGTVLGMYITFTGGTLSNQKILNGMSLALATTIVGLVNSLILTLVLTSLSHLFDRQIEKSYEKGEEMRDVMKTYVDPSRMTEREVAA
ncbi:MAG: MotA/TolQ/ExbB proton channel family protein [bacterium]|nr:MotA/TolQ/ExbB proton channel family protein [bacterium]